MVAVQLNAESGNELSQEHCHLYNICAFQVATLDDSMIKGLMGKKYAYEYEIKDTSKHDKQHKLATETYGMISK